MHPGLEHAAGDAGEQDFRFIAGNDALHGILLERRGEQPVLRTVVDEDHDRAERRRHHIHARPQRELGHETAGRRPHGRLVQVEFGVCQFGLDAIAAGQFQATGTMQDFGIQLPGGRALATFDLLDDTTAYRLPLGAAGEAAIYSQHVHELSLLRKILLRMRSWQNYIFFEAL